MNSQQTHNSLSQVVKKLKHEDKLPAIIFIFSKREGKAVAKMSDNSFSQSVLVKYVIH